MALTKEVIIDKYEVVGKYKFIQCREATIIKEGIEEISRTFKRSIIKPGDDVSSATQEVRDLVAVLHTPELIAQYQADYAASLESE
jgi:hypothetical protein